MAGAAAYSNWDTISGLFDRAVTDATQPRYGYYVQHIWQMKDSSGTFVDKERALCGVHWINTTGGDLDTTWTSADYALVENGFQSYWAGLGSMFPDEFKLVEHRWYAFGPGVLAPNPPSRVTTIASPATGTSANISPHQQASTLTFRTALRRHWGRIYLPMAGGSHFTAGGQLQTADVDNLANSGSIYMKSGSANGLAPVVWDRNRKVALGITSCEVDSVPDIIRRRRPRTPRYKKILTA